LQDVRSIAAEHDERRHAILGELQGLASSIGMFQVTRGAPAPAEIEQHVEPAVQAGDWREATKKIADELGPSLESRSVHALHPHEPRRDTLRPWPSLTERRRRASGG
jgi:hypothetical protein